MLTVGAVMVALTKEATGSCADLFLSYLDILLNKCEDGSVNIIFLQLVRLWCFEASYEAEFRGSTYD